MARISLCIGLILFALTCSVQNAYATNWTADMKEGTKAFLEKRKAAWQGK